MKCEKLESNCPLYPIKEPVITQQECMPDCGGNADFLLSTYAHRHGFVLSTALECL